MIKKETFFLNYLCFILIFYPLFLHAKAVITYELSGGRFGDNLLAYSHAKWLSFSHNIPLTYRPFEYSNQLILHQFENTNIQKTSPQKKILLSTKHMNINAEKNYIYSVPYFAEVLAEHKKNRHWIYFPVDWENLAFKAELKKLIYPINLQLLTSIELPQSTMTVAVHLRTGGGYDSPDAKLTDPLKFPPISFYIKQIKNISKLINHSSLYLYFFTDDRNPEKLVGKIKDKLSNYTNLTFDYRKKENMHNKNVVEDFFAMTKFDCLIRPQSNFSIMAAKISDFKIEISPIAVTTKNNKIKINNVYIKCKEQ